MTIAHSVPQDLIDPCMLHRQFHGIGQPKHIILLHKKFGGMKVLEVKRLKSLEEENSRLKKLLGNHAG